MFSQRHVDRFFAYARERHRIALRRYRDKAPPPWTKDPILQHHRFTNVFREMDRVTRWCRDHVRKERDPESLLMAVVVFRWFNRVSTGEALFCQRELVSGETAFDVFMALGSVIPLRHAILTYVGKKGPWVTGAYTINTRSAGLGKNKLDGVLQLIQTWAKKDWREKAQYMAEHRGEVSLREFCAWAQIDAPCFGPFMAYEVACDLRYTYLLDRAPDILTWANPGPGAQRGLRRLMGSDIKEELQRAVPQDEAIRGMQVLLDASRRQWRPAKESAVDWPAWEMREVEHTLCEFDKYERVRLGQGHPRGSFNGGSPL